MKDKKPSDNRNAFATTEIAKKALTHTQTIVQQRVENTKNVTAQLVRNMQRSENYGAMTGGMTFWAMYNALGQLLYETGYQTQLLFVRLGRFFRAVFLAIFRFVYKWVSAVFGGLFMFLFSVIRDLFLPVQQFFNGLRKTRRVMRIARKKGKDPWHYGWKYFKRGVTHHRDSVHRALMYLLPAGAAVLCFITIFTMFSYTFALAVEYNGEIVGFVENDLVYQEAQNIVKSRIADTQNASVWSADASLTIKPIEKAALSSKTTLADRLVETSSSEIQQATGITVNGTLMGITSEGTQLQEALNAIQAPAMEGKDSTWRPEFINDVATVPGVYFTDTLTPCQDIIDKLTGVAEGSITYVVQQGETLSDIAAKNNLTLAQLYGYNADIVQNDFYKPQAGTKLVVAQAQNYLTVKLVQTVQYEESVPFEIESTADATMEWGKEIVLQEGVDGTQLVTEEVTYVDGQETQKTVVNVVPLTQPVTKRVIYGGKTEFGTVVGEAGSGKLIWPVPDYRYVSRGKAGYHRGIDICAPLGTPVVAADSGLVIAAGWHYSYGYYVQIDHGNGMTTLYAHNSSLNTTVGAYVKQGEVIALMGSTGNSSGNHCHYEIEVDGVLMNPDNYVDAYVMSYVGGKTGWWTRKS